MLSFSFKISEMWVELGIALKIRVADWGGGYRKDG